MDRPTARGRALWFPHPLPYPAVQAWQETLVRDRLDGVDSKFDALMELLEKCEEGTVHATSIAVLFKPLFSEVRAISCDLNDMRL